MITLFLPARLLVSLALLLPVMVAAEPVLSATSSSIAIAATNSLSSHTLSLSEAIQLSTQNQPLLRSLDNAAAASREAAIAIRQLPDPQLKLGVINLPVTGNDAGRFNRDDMTMSTIGVMQDMVPSAKRDAAFQGMQATAGEYQTEKIATLRTIQQAVALAWLDVFEAQRRSELNQRISDEMQAERKVMLSRISSGATLPGEVLKLDSEIAMTNDKKLSAQLAERKARAALSRWIGSDAQRPLADELPVMSVAIDQAGAAIEQHPLLENAKQMEAVAQADVDRAYAERLQNWRWELMYGKRRSDLSDMLSLQIAFDLPWDRANRQDKRTAEKELLAQKAQALTEDRRRELNAEFTSALAELDTAKAREDEHQQRLIPTAESTLKLAQAGYESGKTSLSELWQARRAVLEVEMEHWSILIDMQRAAVKLGYLLNDATLYSGSQS